MDDTRQHGEEKLSCNTQLDCLLEEVTESVLAGYTFQLLSVAQTATDRAESTTRDLTASHQLHPLQTVVKHVHTPHANGSSVQCGKIENVVNLIARDTGKGTKPEFL